MADISSILRYDTYEPAHEGLREALTTLGNGYFATRGAAPESHADEVHYPGTYVAGVYNRLVSEVADRELENESIVNVPNWLPFDFRIDDGEWFDVDAVEILGFQQRLLLGPGLLERSIRFRDPGGRETSLHQRRLVHMRRPHLGALETTIRAVDWSGTLVMRSWIDATVENRGVERYRDLRGDHLEVLERSSEPFVLLRARTVRSRIEIVEAARLRVWRDGERVEAPSRPFGDPGTAGVEVALDVESGSSVRAEKVVALYTSRDRAICEPATAAVAELDQAGDFAELAGEHGEAWSDLWDRFAIDFDLTGADHCRRNVDLHLFHLLQTTSENSIDLDVGIPARGLHGEAYRGHVFWDELFVYPMLTLRVPEIARSLLRYRSRRMARARRAARENGHSGAMFPWQSGSSGREEAQELHLNPRSGRWIPDMTHRQRHIGVAIAYNVWRYFQTTGDLSFLARYGAEMLIEIARFFESLATYDESDGRYDIVGVVGPDEFHTDDPVWEGHGLRNNAYTNVMVSWLLRVVPKALDLLPALDRDRLVDGMGIDDQQLRRWDDISRKLRIPMHGDGIISQFEGYERLEDFPWEEYRRRYGDIQRLDRILESEGDDVNRYKASKQADVLMLMYLFSFEELVDLLDHLGVDFDEEQLIRNVDYYLERTSHGSTLSAVVHSWVLARTDRTRSMELFRRALESDISDIQGGTTAEGIHLGAMAGSVDMLQRGYTGMEMRAGVLHVKPRLPEGIEQLRFRIYVRDRWVEVSAEDAVVALSSEVTSAPPLSVDCRGDRRELRSGETVRFEEPSR